MSTEATESDRWPEGRLVLIELMGGEALIASMRREELEEALRRLLVFQPRLVPDTLRDVRRERGAQR